MEKEFDIDDEDLIVEYYDEEDYPGDMFQEMANLNPRKSGLSVSIWSEHAGILRNKKDVLPRVKVSIRDISISVSIESSPKILVKPNTNIKRSEVVALKEGIDYVGRNYDLFLNHYMDTDNSFDDEDLFDALRERGEYK